MFQSCADVALRSAGAVNSRALRSVTSGMSPLPSECSPSTVAHCRSVGAPVYSASSRQSVKRVGCASVGCRSPMPRPGANIMAVRRMQVNKSS